MRLSGLEYAIKQRYLFPVIRILPFGILIGVIRLTAACGIFFQRELFLLRRLQLIDAGFLRLLKMGYVRTVARLDQLLWRVKFRQSGALLERVEIEGRENLESVLSMDRAIILVTIHSYYFRLLQLWINQAWLGWRPYLVKAFPVGRRTPCWRHEQQLEIFDGRLLDVRRFGVKTIKLLKNKGVVVIAQDVTSERAEPGIFLGQKMRNPFGAAKMAELTGAVILPALVIPGFGKREWAVRFWDPIVPVKGLTKVKLRDAVEEMILEYPELWENWRILIRLLRGQ
jgi:lauroyl/myristoyl acyltransferase